MVARTTLSVRSGGWTAGGPLAGRVRGLERLTGSGWRRVLLLVHGYNNSDYAAGESYGHFIHGVGSIALNKCDAVVEFQWPGDSYLGVMIGAGMYPQTIDTARRAAAMLWAALRQAAAASPGRMRVSVVAHSLGSRLILEALSRESRRPDPRLRIELVVLMAAAVPVTLVREGYLRDGTLAGEARADHLVVLHSTSDRILQVAFPVGQVTAWRLGIEAAAYRDAVGRHGEPFRRASRATSIPTGYGHGDYWSGKETFRAIRRRLGGTVGHSLEEHQGQSHRLGSVQTGSWRLERYELGQSTL